MPIDSTGSTVGYASTAEIAIYDCDNGDRTEDVAFWRGLAHDYGRDQGVIEFGCGTLRLALPIATDGIAVTALDNSSGMLSIARRKLEGLPPSIHRLVVLRHGDMRDEQGIGAFGLAFIAFNTFALLTTQSERVATLRALANQLAPEGVGAVELMAVTQDQVASMQDTVWRPYSHFVMPDGTEVLRESRRRYSAEDSLVHFTVRTRTTGTQGSLPPEWMTYFQIHCFEPGEFQRTAEAAGLRVVEIWGDYQRTQMSMLEGPPLTHIFLVAR